MTPRREGSYRFRQRKARGWPEPRNAPFRIGWVGIRLDRQVHTCTIRGWWNSFVGTQTFEGESGRDHAMTNKTYRNLTQIVSSLAGSIIPVGLTGCATVSPEQEARSRVQYIYYLDGAGGGSALTNWGGGVRQGFVQAGYDGWGEQFRWQTGLGVAVDQSSDVTYKRQKARELADKMQAFTAANPKTPVTLMALSAGTAIAAFTLEALPETFQVQDVVLLGSSLSADYDLSPALRRVRNRMYVFTSEHDAVLRFLVPMSGTADRKTNGARSAGLRGFQPPSRVTPQTAEQYGKLVQIRWSQEFEREGDRGGHTDTVNPHFVRAYLAPLVMRSSPKLREADARHHGTIENPDFRRWASESPGAQITLEGEQVRDGQRSRVRATETLRQKWEDRLYLERTFNRISDSLDAPLVRGFFEWSKIRVEDHPMTHPRTKRTQLPNETMVVGATTLNARCERIEAGGSSADWGDAPVVTACVSEDAPGRLLRIDISTKVEGKPAMISGRVTSFRKAAPGSP